MVSVFCEWNLSGRKSTPHDVIAIINFSKSRQTSNDRLSLDGEVIWKNEEL
ncbi:MAG: hypothetical protein ACLTLQ_00010 [[Clostridium] scindens]